MLKHILVLLGRNNKKVSFKMLNFYFGQFILHNSSNFCFLKSIVFKLNEILPNLSSNTYIYNLLIEFNWLMFKQQVYNLYWKQIPLQHNE